MRGLRLLLVEDNPADAELVEDLLEESGLAARVTRAERLSEALHCLGEAASDLVLLDLSLPDSRGLETFTSLSEAAPRVPAVVLSGQDDEGIALRAVTMGAQDYLVKGTFDGATLARAIRYALERHRLRLELDDARAREREASLAKSRIMAAMNHELRTPLNAIVGYSDLLMSSPGLSAEDARQYAGFIHSAGQHLAHLVEDVLDFGLVDSGRLELRVRTCDLREVLAEAAAIVHPMARIKSLRVDLPPEPLGTVVADPKRLRQVLFNLLTNAVKFTPGGGQVRVEVERGPGEVRVAVSDTGVGVEPADQERIFRAFEQAVSAPGPRTGVGLGLAISRHLVEAHRGRIELESTPGQGSRFTVVLPQPLPVASPAADLPPERRDVLVVEDDVAVAQLIAIYLGQAGYMVRLAGDGQAALDAVAEKVPAAVVLDLKLPGLDGWEVLSRLREGGSTRHLPVVVVSVLDDQGLGLARGADDYLVKPVERTSLVQCVHRLAHLRAGGMVRVLAVDDDRAALSLYAATLEPEGYRVLTADGGEEGLRMAESERPDVILLDLLMPDVDGFQVVSRLRSNPETREIPVVVVTGQEMTEEEKERLRGDISCVLAKGNAALDELGLWLGRMTSARRAPV